jgi:hypothetical protein
VAEAVTGVRITERITLCGRGDDSLEAQNLGDIQERPSRTCFEHQGAAWDGLDGVIKHLVVRSRGSDKQDRHADSGTSQC